MSAEILYKYGRWQLMVDVDEEDDNRKLNYLAMHMKQGHGYTPSHTPYERMSTKAFAAHVFLGFPARFRGDMTCNWDNDTIIAEAEHRMAKMGFEPKLKEEEA